MRKLHIRQIKHSKVKNSRDGEIMSPYVRQEGMMSANSDAPVTSMLTPPSWCVYVEDSLQHTEAETKLPLNVKHLQITI